MNMCKSTVVVQYVFFASIKYITYISPLYSCVYLYNERTKEKEKSTAISMINERIGKKTKTKSVYTSRSYLGVGL